MSKQTGNFPKDSDWITANNKSLYSLVIYAFYNRRSLPSAPFLFVVCVLLLPFSFYLQGEKFSANGLPKVDDNQTTIDIFDEEEEENEDDDLEISSEEEKPNNPNNQ